MSLNAWRSFSKVYFPALVAIKINNILEMENRQKDFQRFCEAVKTDENGLLRNWNLSYPHIIQHIGLTILGFKRKKFIEVCTVCYT